MKQEEFALALNALLPGCDPEAPAMWAEFAAECVEHEQFVYFIPTEHHAAVEKWLDATYAGLYAVKQEYGSEIAAKVAGLSCQMCALYPSEMMSAAGVLDNDGDAERISEMMAYGTLETTDPWFYDLPDGAALTAQGPEIGITRSGVPCGQGQKRIEPGYLLADGTALFSSERDSFGRYRGHVGPDGIYIQTTQLYAPVRGVNGKIEAFHEVKPVMAKERETAFVTDPRDSFAIYRLDASVPVDSPDYVPLAYLQEDKDSPLNGNYNLVHVVQMEQGDDPGKRLDACRAVNTLRPGDIAVFKQEGKLTCWYVDQLTFSRTPGLLERALKAAKVGVKQSAHQIDPKHDVEQVIAGMRVETVHEVTKEGASPGAQLAWYWTYIGSLDMAFMLGLIDDSRRQALYREVKPIEPKNYLITAETSLEQNTNQIDGIINNEAPKPSLRDSLKQCQQEADRSHGGSSPGSPHRDPER